MYIGLYFKYREFLEIQTLYKYFLNELTTLGNV